MGELNYEICLFEGQGIWRGQSKAFEFSNDQQIRAMQHRKGRLLSVIMKALAVDEII
jgi:hypothetical protein